MNMVMERIMNDVLPGNHPQRSCAHIHVPADILPIDTLKRTLTEAFQRGWLSLKCIHTLEQLLALCGSDWFCEKVVMVSVCGFFFSCFFPPPSFFFFNSYNSRLCARRLSWSILVI